MSNTVGWASIEEFAFVGMHPARLRMRHRSGCEFEFHLGPSGGLSHASRTVPTPLVRCSDAELAHLEAAAKQAVEQLLS